MPDVLYVATKAFGAFLAAGVSGPLGPVELPANSVGEAPAPHIGLIQFADGTRAGRLGKPGESLSSSALPDLFRKAIVASEDGDFYRHAGVDPVGIARAVARMMLGGRVNGASTIVQQTVKNTVLGADRTLSRKAAEAVLAIRLTETMSREEILSLYLDSIYFGRGSHGAAGAARAWFDKSWSDLSLGEIAFIAGVIKAPSALDPLDNPSKAKQRRDYVLDRMAETGAVSKEVAGGEKAKPLEAAPRKNEARVKNWVEIAVMRGWPAEAGSGRLATGAAGEPEIVSTIEKEWQSIVERSLKEYLAANFPAVALGSVDLDDGLGPDDWARARQVIPGVREDLARAIVIGTAGREGKALEIALQGGTHLEGEQYTRALMARPRGTYRSGDIIAVSGEPSVGQDGEETERGGTEWLDIRDVTPPDVQGAVVAMDAASGAVLGVAGGYDAALSEFDRSRARRQPGSATKPFLWLAALDSGMAFDQTVLDEPVSIWSGDKLWKPSNYSRGYGGPLPLYEALEKSSNLVAARLGMEIGIERFANVSEAAGVWEQGSMRRHPSAVLGTSETSLVELVGGFAAIANGGSPVTPHIASRISGSGLGWSFEPREERTISGQGNIRLMQSMLRGVAVRGTAARAFGEHKVAVAGKTGTSEDHRDAWFVGFTPLVVVGAWLGRDDNRPLPDRMTGGASAAFLVARIFGDAQDAGLISDPGEDWPPALLEQGEIGLPGIVEGEIEWGWQDTAPVSGLQDGEFPNDDRGMRETHDGSGQQLGIYESARDRGKRRDGNLVFTSPW